ncbi:MAG: alpha/beta fold hydrolase [Acidobacteriota bacterium]
MGFREEFSRQSTRVALALVCALLIAVPSARAQAPPVTPPPQRFTVPADGHPMAVWARLPAAPRAAILLIHGRTWSSRPDFDLQVPGLKRSVLQSLSDRGIAAYAVDLRGYGETPRDAGGYNTPTRAAADVGEVLKWIAARHPGLDKPAVLGWSNGGLVAQLVGQRAPALVSSVTLFGYTPETEYRIGTPMLPVPKVAPKTRNSADGAASDFITPQVTPPAVVKAFVSAALASDPILAEWKDDQEWNALKAERMFVPIMLLHGSNDPGASASAAGEFLAAVGSRARSYVVLPLADHCAQLEDTHDAWISAVVEFITRPGPVRR